MGFENGKVPADHLSTVAVGVQLSIPTANAFRALILQGVHEHIAIKAAAGEGSGYRSLDVQEDFWKADHGDKAMQAKTQHYPSKGSTPVAWPGGSSHGWGDRIDLLFDGSARPNAAHLNLAKRFGFTREFDSADPNHFEHDGKTAIHPPAAPAVQHAPAPEFYTVRPGDNLTHIAAGHQISLSQLEHLNPQIPDYNLIRPGEKIRVK